MATAGVAALAVAAVLAAHQPAPPQPRAARLEVTLGPPPPSDPAVGGAVPWWLVPVALVLAVLVVSLLWFVFRDGLTGRVGSGREVHRDDRDDEYARHAAGLAASAGLAFADAEALLAAGADAREVVVACWVRIEQAAEAAGLGRRPAETATDVARRWLAGSPDRAAVDDLAALYHLARYSTRVMTDADRDRARTALRGVSGLTTTTGAIT